MRTKRTVTTIAAWAIAAVAATTHAQTPADVARGRDLAATCANCHGTGGKAQPPLPALAGQPRADLVQKMNDFRDGKRPATIMHQIAKGYTNEQVEAMAAWFEQQKP